MGRRKTNKAVVETVEKEDPVHWTVDMESELYKTVARVLDITDGSMTTKAAKHQRVAELLTSYCVDELGMDQFKDKPLTEMNITDKMDSVKRKIKKLFENGQYQKKGETGREATDEDIIDVEAVQRKWACVGAYMDAFKDHPSYCLVSKFNFIIKSISAVIRLSPVLNFKDENPTLAIWICRSGSLMIAPGGSHHQLVLALLTHRIIQQKTKTWTR